MRKTLEDFYYGNITPCEQLITANSDLSRAVNKVPQCESRPAERIDETGKTFLTELVKTQHKINSTTALENFILGFRLGVRIMTECMEENDGDTQEVTGINPFGDHHIQSGTSHGSIATFKAEPVLRIPYVKIHGASLQMLDPAYRSASPPSPLSRFSHQRGLPPGLQILS